MCAAMCAADFKFQVPYIFLKQCNTREWVNSAETKQPASPDRTAYTISLFEMTNTSP